MQLRSLMRLVRPDPPLSGLRSVDAARHPDPWIPSLIFNEGAGVGAAPPECVVNSKVKYVLVRTVLGSYIKSKRNCSAKKEGQFSQRGQRVTATRGGPHAKLQFRGAAFHTIHSQKHRGFKLNLSLRSRRSKASLRPCGRNPGGNGSPARCCSGSSSPSCSRAPW